MPALIIGALIQVVGTLAAKVLLSIGVGAVTYTGMSVAFGWIGSSFFSAAGTLSAGVLGVMGVLKVGTCFKILTSALTMRMTLSGVNSTVTRLKLK